MLIFWLLKQKGIFSSILRVRGDHPPKNGISIKEGFSKAFVVAVTAFFLGNHATDSSL